MASATCPIAGYTSCSKIDSRLPENFCCSSTETCLSLDDGSSALCCPKGADCGKIRPIFCNIQLQNATSNADTVYTTRLNDSLPLCASACCPFGYECDGQNCVLIATGSHAENGTRNSTPTSVPGSSNTATPDNGRKHNTKIALAIVIPLIVIILVLVSSFLFLQRRRHKLNRNQNHKDQMQEFVGIQELDGIEQPQLRLQPPSESRRTEKSELTVSVIAQTPSTEFADSPVCGVARTYQLTKPKLLDPSITRKPRSVYELE